MLKGTFSSRVGNRKNFPLSRLLLLCPLALILVVPFSASPLFSSSSGQTPARAPHAHSHHVIGLSNSITPNGTDRNIRVAQASSSNWGGYAVASSFSSPVAVITAVEGSWVVQTVLPSSSATYSAQWIGIGGYFMGDASLIQTGTESDSTGGVQSYDAWYELLPASETSISTITVSPGDTMSASVICTASCTSTTQTWTISIEDMTTGKSFSTSVSYASSLLSAEWIEERPEVCSIVCSLTTLANFGTADFGFDYTAVSSTDYATVSSVSSVNTPIGSLTSTSITMDGNSGNPIAQPSALSSDGTELHNDLRKFLR